MRKKFFMAVTALVALVLLICSSKLVEDVDARKIVVKQAMGTGTMSYWTTPGLKWQGWGKLTEYDKSVQVWFSNNDTEGGSDNGPLPVRYNCGGTAMISGSVRVELPTDPIYMEKIQFKFGSMERLMHELIKPTIKKAVGASGPMMTAYESYAEKKNDFMRYTEDQISNGVYQTIIKEVKTKDEVSGDEKVVRLAIPVEDIKAVNGIKRQELPPFQEFGLKIVQVALVEFSYDDKVQAQIQKQQQIMMDMKTSYADALKAKQDAIKEEEMGKARTAKAKWAQEELKATAVTKAEQEREVSRLAAEKAEFDKKKIVAQGQAEAEANRLKVQAGLTPQERAEWDYKTAVGVAEALANSKQPIVPAIMVTGDNKGGTNPMDVVGMNMLMDLSKKLNK